MSEIESESCPWLDELNREQHRAATHSGGPLLVLAGAGTGKTTTLVARVAWLIAQGVAAERILLLSFTRRAAREMVQRARTLTARVAPGSGPIQGGTFHSVAHRVVRSHASALGLPASFGVLDAGDAADLLDLLRQEQGLAGGRRRFPRKQTVLDIYSRTVNAQCPLSDVLADAFPWCDGHRDALAGLFRAYGTRKRALGLLDLDDLLLCWHALVRDPAQGAALAGEFDHVLVDEYQDVNALQVDIVRGLGGVPPALGATITVVGDDFQAIYGFRAASARHILSFPAQVAGTHTVTLEHNYRSTPAILAVANAVSAQDRGGFPKHLRSDRPAGATPELVFPLDEHEQAVQVSDRVLDAREQAIDLRHQAVLFRTSHDSALLELELTRRDIPFVKYGGLRYLEAAHVKDFIALLRLADNRADLMSWFRVLQLLEGVGPVRAGQVLGALREHPQATPDLRRWTQATGHLPPGAQEQAEGLIAALREDRRRQASPARRAERLRDAIAPLLRERYPDATVRLLDLDGLVASAPATGELGHFVSELALDPPASTSDWAGPPRLDEDYLVLSTVHSAKGLEWEAVHLIAAYDGNFPADMATGDDASIAEERRLFYVALTRARRRLCVYVPVRYHHRPQGTDDAHGYGRASRFLTEEVQSLFCVERRARAASPAPSTLSPLIAVSPDALFH